MRKVKKMKRTKPAQNRSAKTIRPKARTGSLLARPALLSRSRLAIFTVAFAAVGIYLLFTSFAATNVLSISGKLNNKSPSATHTVNVTASGELVATVNFSRLKNLSLQLKDQSGTVVGSTTSTISPVSLSRPVSTGNYQLVVSGSGNGTYSGSVTYPTPDNPPPPSDTTPPSAPAGLDAAAVSSSQINLTWSAATDNVGVTAYEIYRAGSTTPFTTTVVTSYSDTGLAPGTTYGYYVRARDAAGNRSPASNTDNATTFAAADTTKPSVAITSPANGATVSGTISITGTASDNTALAKVEVQVDGNGYLPASGTASWTYSMNTAQYSNGSHTVTARATDTAGNQQTATLSLSVSNGTSTTTAPTTQGTWTSPEGAVIEVNTAGTNPATGQLWNIADIYRLLRENSAAPGDLARIAPNLTIRVQDVYASSATRTVIGEPGNYTSVQSILWLKGVDSTFSILPDSQFGHEYGHIWAGFHRYLAEGGNWAPYLDARGLTGDSRLETSYSWHKEEIIAEDYRLLFGSLKAKEQYHLNSDIPKPSDVPGLRDFLLGPFRTP
jgi:chitodextrinase